MADDAPTSQHSTDNESVENGEPVESLIAGRARRATAGNRLSNLVEKEQDDEIGLLFAETAEAEDESFDEDDGEDEDVNMGSSSSDDDDHNADGKDDEMAGEKELQKQARLESKKRRARDRAKIPGMVRKRVKIDPTAMAPPRRDGAAPTPPRPKKKKSERVSWVASAADAPTRTSTRKQTVQNREIVHKRIVDNEKHRRKIMRQMEEAQKRKDASKPKALTQAQRMAEAAKIEQKNAKSLNRWEEEEAKRAAERKAKLEALHSRQLTGPVITWWSGLAHWVDGKVRQLGVKEIRKSGLHESNVDVQVDAVGPNTSEEKQQEKADDAAEVVKEATDQSQQQTEAMDIDAPANEAAAPADTNDAPSQATQIDSTQPPDSHTQEQPPQHSTTQPPPAITPRPIETYASRTLLVLQSSDSHTPKLLSSSTISPDESPYLQAFLAPTTTTNPSNSTTTTKRKYTKRADRDKDDLLTGLTPTGRPRREYNTQSKLEEARREKPHCAVNPAQVARFRDPGSGLGYGSSAAYGQIRRLLLSQSADTTGTGTGTNGGANGSTNGTGRERPVWSSLLDCFVGPIGRGSGGVAARGVPERFFLVDD